MSKVKDWVDRRQCYPGTEDFLKGQDLLDFAREERGNTIILSFGRGKDSLAMWLYLRENGFDIVPYAMYIVPGLGYQERALEYYEDFFDVHIMRFPHPDLYYYLKRGHWQPPHQLATVKALDLPWFDFAALEDFIAFDQGLDNPFCAVGMRRADNLLRMTFIDQGGVVGFKKRRFFYAVWDWKIKEVADIIGRYDLAISVEYEMFGRTSDQINYRRMLSVSERYPEDYAKILQWFPLADMDLFRYNMQVEK